MTDTTRDLIQRLADELYKYECLTSRRPPDCIPAPSPLIDEARAYLSQPEPKEPTDEELEEFALKHGGGYFNCDCQAEADILTRKHVSNYRAALARWSRPAIEPVPVSERPWEREGWCDNNGWCWCFDADGTDPCWSFDRPESWVCWTHVLPHYALPIPITMETP